jgi:hypothetical protein
MILSHSNHEKKHGKNLKSFGKDAKIIVDSGTSYFLMPKKDRDLFLEYLKESRGIKCHSESIPRCECDENAEYPDLIFNINGTHYFIPKENYFIKSGKKCYLGIMSSSSMKIWILGLNFF